MRQKEDGQFAQLLNRLRTHIKGQPLNQQDIDVLSSVSFNQTPESCSKVLHIFPTNKEVRKHNEEMLKDVCDTLVMSKAQDYFKNSTSGKLTLRDEPYPKCSSGDLQDFLELGSDARVILIRNLDTEDGLVNGAFGTVTGFEKTKTGNITAVFVKFDNPDIGRATILKTVTKKPAPKHSVRIPIFEDSLHGKNVIRKQLLLRLSWGATIHKVQGMTMKEIVVSLKRTFASGVAYVALSRVSSLNGLHIIDFDADVIYASEDITKAVDAMDTFVSTTLVSSPEYSHLLTFHNTEGCLPHREDIIQFAKTSSIICLNETWLKTDATTLPEFDAFCQSRNESYASANEPFAMLKLQERGGVATFVWKELRLDGFMFATTDMEYVAFTAYLPTETLVVNIYKPPVYPIRLFCTILGKLLAEINVKMPQIPCVILGDFNDNILKGNSQLVTFMNQHDFTQIVNDVTTEAGTCLDLVFINKLQH
jgi:hypothetical protein